MSHLILLDASGYIHRAHHALPELTREDGQPIGAVLGYINMLLKLQRSETYTHIAAVFDPPRRNSFRVQAYTEYKSNRGNSASDDASAGIGEQFGMVREATRAMGIPTIEYPGIEADDVLASYAMASRKEKWQTTIVTSDKDLMQLIPHGIDILDTLKNLRYRTEDVVDRFGVYPHQIPDFLALTGDSSDGIPGLYKVGGKTAATLLKKYGDLFGILFNAHNIPQKSLRNRLLVDQPLALMCYNLVELRTDIPMLVPLAKLNSAFDKDGLIKYCEQQGFTDLLKRLVKPTKQAPSNVKIGKDSLLG